ncbi:unnamed protein product [marine sediment metagenome]|uniref:Uncharacterized protein n=1 Tax=marine sediment metagenome TaxID=412755 RepID=X1LIP4_9ZZZZ
MEEGLIKRLIASIKCNVCGQHYEVDNIKVLDHHQDLWFLSVFCSACYTRYLVAAVIKQDRVPEVVTDLTEIELDKFKNVDRLTTDELLDMHNFLKNFDGDFSRLFRQR